VGLEKVGLKNEILETRLIRDGCQNSTMQKEKS